MAFIGMATNEKTSWGQKPLWKLNAYTVYEGRRSTFMGQYSVSVKRLWKAAAIEVGLVF